MALGLYRGLQVRWCRRCEAHPRKPGQRWCKACHAEYMRAWRRKRHPIVFHAFHMKQQREAA